VDAHYFKLAQNRITAETSSLFRKAYVSATATT
jgi:hypothetical protein